MQECDILTQKESRMSDKVSLVAQCLVCKKTKHLMVYIEDYGRWQRGDLIQEAFPYLSVDDREILISSTCGPCFDSMFSEEE